MPGLGPVGAGLAFLCEICDDAPKWRFDRRGDAVVSWACAEHFDAVADRLQRDWEITELVVSLSTKRREWTEIATALDEEADRVRD